MQTSGIVALGGDVPVDLVDGVAEFRDHGCQSTTQFPSVEIVDVDVLDCPLIASEGGPSVELGRGPADVVDAADSGPDGSPNLLPKEAGSFEVAFGLGRPKGKEMNA